MAIVLSARFWMNVIESSRPRTASEGHATVGKNRGRTLCPFGAGELNQAPTRTLRMGLSRSADRFDVGELPSSIEIGLGRPIKTKVGEPAFSRKGLNPVARRFSTRCSWSEV